MGPILDPGYGAWCAAGVRWGARIRWPWSRRISPAPITIMSPAIAWSRRTLHPRPEEGLDALTRGSDLTPTRRLLESLHGPLVVELRESTVVIRPKGTRRNGPLEVIVRAGSVYQRALEQKLAEQKRARKKARKEKRRG
jgi:hypothetical protein